MKSKILVTLAIVAILSLGCLTSCSDGTSSNPNDQATVSSKVEEKVYQIGETWTVDGQWSLTINSVKATEERNEFSDLEPAAVYLIDYSYENIGYEDSNGIMDGLYFDLSGESIIDNAKTMGYSYPGDISVFPQETPVGANCKGQSCIGVDNAGDFKITVVKYDGNGQKQQATFSLTV